MKRTKYINLPRSVRVDPDLSRSLRILAEKDHRSVANLINLILLEYVENHKEEVVDEDLQ